MQSAMAVVALAVAIVTAGCGAGVTSRGDALVTTTPVTTPAVATTPSTTPIADADPLPTIPGQGSPGQAVAAKDGGDVDTALTGLDDALAGLDRLLNQATASLAAEEGEIIP